MNISFGKKGVSVSWRGEIPLGLVVFWGLLCVLSCSHALRAGDGCLNCPKFGCSCDGMGMENGASFSVFGSPICPRHRSRRTGACFPRKNTTFIDGLPFLKLKTGTVICVTLYGSVDKWMWSGSDATREDRCYCLLLTWVTWRVSETGLSAHVWWVLELIAGVGIYFDLHHRPRLKQIEDLLPVRAFVVYETKAQ